MIEVRKAVIVKNYAISGSLFMMSLLDGHPQIITLPMSLNISVIHLWNRIVSEKNFSRQNIFIKIQQDIPSFFNANYSEESCKQMGESGNERLEVNQDEFFFHLGKLFDEAQSITRKKFITAVFLAYNLCNGREFDSDAIICFSAHEVTLPYVQWMLEDFEELYFLHMIREPVQNFGSLMKALNFYMPDYVIFNSMLEDGIRSIIFDQLIEPMNKIRKYQYSGEIVNGKSPCFNDVEDGNKIISSRGVKLEDVHLCSQETMQKICDWLKVDWSDNLMTSTFDGKKWYNRSSYLRVSGFSDKIVSQKYDKYLNCFDRYRLKLLGKRDQISFKYRKITFFDYVIFYTIFPLLCLVPFKIEFDYDRLKRRISAFSRVQFKSELISKDWIAHNYNKPNFRSLVNKKMGEKFDNSDLRIINDWLNDNHRLSNFTNNFYKFLKTFESKILTAKVNEWILNNCHQEIDFAGEVNLEMEKTKILKYLPALFKRAIINYKSSRTLILQAWKREIFQDFNLPNVKLL